MKRQKVPSFGVNFRNIHVTRRTYAFLVSDQSPRSYLGQRHGEAPAPGAQPKMQAAYLTHELRAPVTSIRLSLQILAEQTEARLHGDEKQMLSVAIRNTLRLESLVNDIMDYSKISAGKLSLVKEPCDPRALLDDAADCLRATATSKGIKIIKNYSPLLPRCLADERRVVQVLMNLLSNALKFTPANGQIKLSVEEGRFEHAGTLLFKVKDTGCGIDSSQLDNIFKLFEQAGTDRQRSSTGTGLGLTLAKAMVELHGGRIWAESWKGGGATLCFTVPVAPADLCRPIETYPQPLQITGLLAGLAQRFNAFLAIFI